MRIRIPPTVLGMMFGAATVTLAIVIQIKVNAKRDAAAVIQTETDTHECHTVEAWGAGYAKGFNDSVELCRGALQQQREMMLEQMEPPPPGWNSATTPGSGTDRHGVALPGPWSSALPQDSTR